MLGDQSDKPKNPLKKAMRRRNAKNVQFAPPTYVEASDNDWSSSEDEEDGQAREMMDQSKQGNAQNGNGAAVKPLSLNSRKEALSSDQFFDDDDETLRNSDENFDSQDRSRNGTVRNTDSFFKDETTETKKINLTPNILRDESAGIGRTSEEVTKELRSRPSLEKLDKDSKDDKSAKEDKKKKDKKSGILGGLFKRKDKKSKNASEEPVDDLISGKKTNEDSTLSPTTSKESTESIRVDTGILSSRSTSPSHPAGKPPKQFPLNVPTTKQANVLDAPVGRVQQPPFQSAPIGFKPDTALRAVPLARDNDVEENAAPIPSPIVASGTQSQVVEAANLSESKDTKASASGLPVISSAISRMALDDSDDSATALPIQKTSQEPLASPELKRPIPGAFPDSYMTLPQREQSDDIPDEAYNALQDSASQDSSIPSNEHSELPALVVDTSSQDENERPSPASSPSSNIEHQVAAPSEKTVNGRTSSARSTPTWSDQHLRTFFDDREEIRDLFAVVYDTTNVEPAGKDHPFVGELFRDEQAKLADITAVSVAILHISRVSRTNMAI